MAKQTSPFIIRLDLGNAPDIAAELGHMCVAWAAMEFRIFVLFFLITKIPMALARATFYSHYNARNRISLLRAVAGMILQTEGKPLPEMIELDRLLTKIGKTAKARNQYVHDPWGAWTKKPAAVFQMRLGGRGLLGEGTPIRKTQLFYLTNQIQAEHRQLHDLLQRVRPLLPPLRRQLDKTRFLALAFSRKGLPREIRRARRPRRQPSSQE